MRQQSFFGFGGKTYFSNFYWEYRNPELSSVKVIFGQFLIVFLAQKYLIITIKSICMYNLKITNKNRKRS